MQFWRENGIIAIIFTERELFFVLLGLVVTFGFASDHVLINRNVYNKIKVCRNLSNWCQKWGNIQTVTTITKMNIIPPLYPKTDWKVLSYPARILLSRLLWYRLWLWPLTQFSTFQQCFCYILAVNVLECLRCPFCKSFYE